MSTPFDLDHFVTAQAPVMDAMRRELAAGRKTSHWMWFVFPQIAGLGRSEMAQCYAIVSRDEAISYLAHPILGPRLVQCTALVLGVEGRSAHDIFGSPDDMKFNSSLTLFDAVSPADNIFSSALAKYFGGTRDAATLKLLGSAS